MVVSKYAALADVEAAYQAGVRDFGESRAQDLRVKQAHFSAYSDPPRWHFMGHLQRNKIAKVLPLVSSLHSVDSLTLAQALEEYCQKNALSNTLDVFLEINLSGEAQKHGFDLTDLKTLEQAWTILGRTPQLRLAGLMGMSSANASTELVRKQFADLRALRDLLGSRHTHSGLWLSMGMSQDYAVALAEDANVLRIGSLLFEE